jgi:hypothetical protein
MADRTQHPTLSPQYTLGYGMRLDKGTAPELTHPHVSVALPDGSEGGMALHVINGTPDEIKARLLESVDAFFEIHTNAGPSIAHESTER